MKGYTLEEHIDLFDISEGVSLIISSDPDTGSMVNIRAVDARSKRFYGDLYLSMVPEAALQLAKGLKMCVVGITQRMQNPPEDGHHALLRKFRIYNDDCGGYIEVRPHVEDFASVQMWTPEKEGAEYFGKVDMSLTTTHATELAKAIEMVQQSLEHK